MANVDRVTGFKPVRYDQNKVMTGYKAAGTTVTHDLAVGDPVTFSGSGDANGIPGVSEATAGDANAILGVVIGFKPDPDHLGRGVWVDGADAAYPLVLWDPDAIYEAQADESLTYTDVGLIKNGVVTAATDRTTGKSGWEIDATATSSATGQFRVVGFPQRPDNTIGSADVKVYVMINNHVLKGGTGTAGI